MKQGEKGDEFFFIVEGTCKVLVNTGNDTDSKNDKSKTTVTEIAQLGEGDYCGEQALLQDATRNATVEALTDVKCLVLNQSSFKEVVKESNLQFAKRDAKRYAISAEFDFFVLCKTKKQNKQKRSIDPKLYEKDEKRIEWLLQCVKENILFQHLDQNQKRVVVEQMYKQNLKQDEFLIKQGEEGNHFYVVESGTFTINVQDIGQVDTLHPGRCVGELALLYNAPRAASVQATSDAVVWCVDRHAFRKALMNTNTASSETNIAFLKKCPLFQSMLKMELQLIDHALESVCYAAGNIVFHLGDVGDKFYLIKSGKVSGETKDKVKFERTKGDFFGERALLTSEPRAATVQCISYVKENSNIHSFVAFYPISTKLIADCELLFLHREDFISLLGPLEEIMKRNMQEYEMPVSENKQLNHALKNDICKLKEFEIVGILGRGAFGTVKLVVDPYTNTSYALKAIRKNQVVELGQQSHILNEKRVMQLMDSPFLVNLRGTFKDEFRIYFLLEACLGGELFTVLRKMRSFDENTAKFYAACVVEAFDYMHQRDIVYRDLKPENLVFTDKGYLKITDFGFAKVVQNKTFTLCGTPDYLSPEIVTGQGHGKAVDWWTLGILIYEMLASFPPFFDDEPLMTYRKIIQGTIKFPRYLSIAVKDLISKFLKPKPTKRYGILKGGTALIRCHPWFQEFDWSALRQLKLRAPIRPKVKSPKDLSNFDHFQEKEEDVKFKVDPDLDWDKDF
ncbi:hypothetical protein RFI_37875 [Reticulomyxa filosa]|uniref:cGMP-dependent protein kinase n=1 Tax=Reticulomyxa filosa TaxID=46433 RepID=X6LDZ2_RETFI|nr:hypothetical protein RFI_37875 [Reticulomyxa filosa]|eukprot:ETN99595.1 hypothetical protein RFI_37875 [Reticulomyxa filosa]